MAGFRLKRLFRRQNAALIRELAEMLNSPIKITDEKGEVLFAIESEIQNDSSSERISYPLLANGETIGHVEGLEHAKLLHSLVERFAEQEINKKAIGSETLNLYREINLLYNLAEKLSAEFDVQSVSKTALTEASRLIESTAGVILLADADGTNLKKNGSFGEGLPDHLALQQTPSLVVDVFNQAKAEIINDVPADPRANTLIDRLPSMICVPLIGHENTLGVITLANHKPVIYTAGDLKLVQAVASQTSPAIESAIRYEKAVTEAKSREERLKRQIEALKIELDEQRQEEKVSEITETDYFKNLRSQAKDLRKMFNDDD